jgi:hypothetical protein
MDERPLAECFELRRGIAHAFTALQTAVGPFWLAGVLLSISECNGTSIPLDLARMGSTSAQHARLVPPHAAPSGLSAASSLDVVELGAWLIAYLLIVIAVGACVALVLVALSAWISVGSMRLHLAVLEHASDDLGPLFSGRDRFWAMLGYELLAGFTLSAAVIVPAWPGALLAYVGYARHSQTLQIAGVGAALFCALPVLVWVALGTYLGAHAVVLEQASPAHALRRSFELAARGRGPLFSFAFVCLLVQLVSGLGVLLCFVGVLATVPFARSLTAFAKTESFLLLTRGYAQAADWKLWQRDALANRPAKTAVAFSQEEPPAQD